MSQRHFYCEWREAWQLTPCPHFVCKDHDWRQVSLFTARKLDDETLYTEFGLEAASVAEEND